MRTLHLWLVKFLICFSLTVWMAASPYPAPAADGYPEKYHMSMVEVLAVQIDDSAAELIRTIHLATPPEADIADAVLRLEDLRRAAADFRREVRIYYMNPTQTTTAWLQLRQAYALARPVIANIPRTTASHDAAHKLVDSMAALGGYYAAPPVAARYDDALRQDAAAVMRLAGRLAANVRDLELRGLVSRAASDNFTRLGEAAYRFYDLVRSAPHDSDILRDAYVDLVYRIQDVRDIVGDTNLAVQTEFGQLWTHAERLTFLAPSIPLGTYEVHEFYR